MAEQQAIDSVEPLHVRITRVPFCDWFTFHLDDGSTEDLTPDQAREWFKLRGGDVDKVEKVLDYVWNFYKTDAYIKEPRQSVASGHRLAPKL